MKKTVKLFGVRHGDNKGDELTPEGRLRIKESMKKNAPTLGDTVLTVYTSLRRRTNESALMASDSSVFRFFPMPNDFKARAGFDYYGAPVSRAPEFTQAVKEMIGDGPENIGAWVLAAPEWTNSLTRRVDENLKCAVIETIIEFPNDQHLVSLIFSHSPTIELPAGRDFPRLRPADIVLYTYEVDMDDKGEITSLERIGTFYLQRD